jgi:arylsulfatase A-like enzyme
VVIPRPGVIYAGATATKIAEHGGFSEDDVHVLLVVSNPQLVPGASTAAVQTTQIAPTILSMLGLDPQKLQAVQLEKTPTLPGLQLRP